MNKADSIDTKYDLKVWEKRRVKVMEFINQNQINKILDLGCGEGKLITYLLSLELGLSQIFGIDIDGNSLEIAKNHIENIIKYWKIDDRKMALYNKKKSTKCINIDIFKENLLTKNEYFKQIFHNIDLITFIEVIEHLPVNDAENCFDIILGYYKPKKLIVTTPNKDYNVLFEMKDDQMRNDDHKFEWTKEEFYRICTKFGYKFNYIVEFDGVGFYNEKYGYSTQICYFHSNSKPYSIINEERHKDYTYPFYTAKYSEINRHRIKFWRKSIIAYEITNAYNYFRKRMITDIDYIDFRKIYSYYRIKNLFKSYKEFIRVISRLKLEEFNLMFNDIGVQYRPNDYEDDNIDCY